MWLRCLYFGIIWLIFINDCPGQPFYFKKFEVDEGISNNSVINTLQDKKGYLWFGTPDGLNRYDGNNFKIFKNLGKPGDLKSNAIYYLHNDPQGVLWVGTERGLYRFNDDNQSFTLLKNTEGRTIRAIQSDNNGGLWMADQAGLCIYYPAKNTITRLSADFLNGATSIAKSNDGKIWIGCRKAILAGYDPFRKIFSIYKMPERDGGSIEKILPIGDSTILTGTSLHGVLAFDRKKNIFSNIPLSKTVKNLFVHDILQNKLNELWVATESGLYIYDSRTKNSTIVKKIKGDPYSISNNAIYSLCKDKEGGVWVGTYFGGINYYSNPSLVFEKFFPGFDERSISGTVIREISEDKHHNLWIGTEDAGLARLNVQRGIFEASGINIASTNIHGLLADGDDLYIGTFERGMYVADLNTKKIKHHFETGSVPELKSDYINTISKRSPNEIVIGTSNGLYLFDKTRNQLNPIPEMPTNAFYSAVVIDSAKTIWAATHSDGLLIMDTNKVVRRLRLESKTSKDLLADTRILNLYFDNEQNLLVSTEDGVFIADLHNRKCIRRTYLNGLPGNMVYAVVQDRQNNFWISTSKGLARMARNGNDIKIFRKSDGLLSEQFNYRSSFLNDAGEIFLGSVKGLIKFNPAGYRENKFVPPILPNTIRLYSNDADARAEEKENQFTLANNNSIKITHRYASFSIDFSILSFKSPDHINFAYKLEPVDNTWNLPGKSKSVSFTNLHPGNYRLRVKSSNASGLWLPNERLVNIVITPPFWRSQTAYFLYTAVAALGIFFMSSFISKRNKEKHKRRMEAFAIKKEKELYEAKIDFYTNVAHEIKTPLSLIKAPLEKIRQHTAPSPLVSRYMDILNKNTERLLDLSGQLLDLRKFEAAHYHLNFTKVDIIRLTHVLYESFHNLADDKGIKYDFVCIDSHLFVNADEEALKKIISNLLDNAIKYADHTVEISIDRSANSIITVSFKNDGELIPEDEQQKIFEPFYRVAVNSKIKGSGIGLSLVKTLAQLNHAKIEYQNDKKQNIFIFMIKEYSED